jgi:hypothetical protein
MDPSEQFLGSGIIKIYRGSADRATTVKVTRSDEPGRVPGVLFPYQWCVNTADQRLWIGNSNGKPVEYQLVEVLKNE